MLVCFSSCLLFFSPCLRNCRGKAALFEQTRFTSYVAEQSFFPLLLANLKKKKENFNSYYFLLSFSCLFFFFCLPLHTRLVVVTCNHARCIPHPLLHYVCAGGHGIATCLSLKQKSREKSFSWNKQKRRGREEKKKERNRRQGTSATQRIPLPFPSRHLAKLLSFFSPFSSSFFFFAITPFFFFGFNSTRSTRVSLTKVSPLLCFLFFLSVCFAFLC